jgi:hypothetical protein
VVASQLLLGNSQILFGLLHVLASAIAIASAFPASSIAFSSAGKRWFGF